MFSSPLCNSIFSCFFLYFSFSLVHASGMSGQGSAHFFLLHLLLYCIFPSYKLHLSMSRLMLSIHLILEKIVSRRNHIQLRCTFEQQLLHTISTSFIKHILLKRFSRSGFKDCLRYRHHMHNNYKTNRVIYVFFCSHSLHLRRP